MAHDGLGHAIVVVGWTAFTLSSLVVGGRFYTRVFYLKHVRKDDMLIFASWVSLAVVSTRPGRMTYFQQFLTLYNTVLITIDVHYGLGTHIQYLQPPQIAKVSLLFVLIKFPSVFASYLARMSFSITLLYTVRNTGKRTLRHVVWATMAIETFFTIFVIFQAYAQCGKYGSELVMPSAMHDQRCMDGEFETKLGYAQSGNAPT